MKNQILKTTSILICLLVLTSCKIDMLNRVNGNKNVTIDKRKLSNNFNKIKASTGLDVYITQGERTSLTVEADENLQEIIKTKVENNVLKIYTDKNIWDAASKKVHITIVDLDEIKASSGCDVSSKNIINTKSLIIKSSSGAVIDLTINTEHTETSASSGANIYIKGTTKSHISSASSGSAIKANKLISNKAQANVSSGANINIYADEKFEGNASSGGDIDVSGQPKETSKNESSGGNISKI